MSKIETKVNTDAVLLLEAAGYPDDMKSWCVHCAVLFPARWLHIKKKIDRENLNKELALDVLQDRACPMHEECGADWVGDVWLNDDGQFDDEPIGFTYTCPKSSKDFFDKWVKIFEDYGEDYKKVIYEG
ncbi:hypothetical protein OAK04_00995 [Verrucomicrobia bacterium]|nr:hypothetical protein [Verrucomicrobiota bacterium]